MIATCYFVVEDFIEEGLMVGGLQIEVESI